jgi:hypothetical protein
MLREKDCHLKTRIYKVDYLKVFNHLVHEEEVYYEAESQAHAIQKWVNEHGDIITNAFVRCTEVPIQWN